MSAERQGSVTPSGLLYVQPVAEKGGMEVNLVNEIRLIDRSIFTPIVACLEDGPLVDELSSVGAQLHKVPHRRMRNLAATVVTMAHLVRIIRTKHVSVVVSQNSYVHIYARPAAVLTGTPILLRSGGVSHPLEWVDRIAFRLGASCYIANSAFTRRAMLAAGVPAERLRMVYRGVDAGTFAPQVSTIREELGISRDALVVTVIGRLQKLKGQHIAVAAAAQVMARFPNARLLVVGGALFGIESEYPEKLRRLVQLLNLGEYVKLLGNRSDISNVLHGSDVVLAPSISPEGFGMVVIEAMAAGKPVIATDTGASPEIISHGVTGLLVPPNEPEPLALAIMRLLGDTELRHTLGAQAAAAVQERFVLSQAVLKYEQLYLECLRSGTVSRSKANSAKRREITSQSK